MAATIDGLKQELDNIEAIAEAYGDVTSEDEHRISILDTPRLWSKFKKTITSADEINMGVVREAGVEAIAKLAGSMRTIIAEADTLVDVTSLNAPFTAVGEGGRAPSDAFGKAIAAGIAELVERNKRSSPRTVIRMTFGIYPGDDTFPDFVKYMSQFWSELWDGVEAEARGVELYLAQFSTVAGSPGIILDGVRGEGSIWNHSKIIAADSCLALVGGHNMVEADYGGAFAPCHDLSLLHRGVGVAHAHKFCNYLWDQENKKVVRYVFNDETEKFEKIKTQPFKETYATRLTNAYSRACQRAKVKLGLEDPVPEVVIDIEEEVREEHDERDEVRIQIGPSVFERVKNASPDKLDFDDLTWARAAVMGVGRTGGWLDGAGTRLVGLAGKVSPDNPSDVAKQYVIDHAVRNLFICQQDLAFRSGAQETNHWTMVSIINRLSASWRTARDNPNGALRVRVVVTPFGGAAKDQYSWGSGAVDTWALFYSLAMGWVGGRSTKTSIFSMWTKSSINEYILDRLCVAPLCFADWRFERELDYDNPEANPDPERFYFWPEPTSTIPVFSLSNLALYPKLTSAKYRRAPAHHAKTYLADNDMFYVGSDNWYPHTLAEYGYIVSGSAAVNEYKAKYAANVWKYSGPHCVNPRHDPNDDLHKNNHKRASWFHPSLPFPRRR